MLISPTLKSTCSADLEVTIPSQIHKKTKQKMKSNYRGHGRVAIADKSSLIAQAL